MSSRSATIETDLSAWPLMLVTLPDAEVSDAEVQRFIDGQRAALSRNEKHAAVADASHARPVTPTQRKMMADWLKESKPESARNTVAMAVVIDNAIVRGAMTAVLWLTQPACPTKIFGTLPEALDWAILELRRAGVPNLARAEAMRGSLARKRSTG